MKSKLVIQIPAFNEEENIAEVIKSIPDSIEGIKHIETVVINDGSADKTVEVARQAKATHIIGFSEHCGLGRAFKSGLAYALEIGADIIVNFDADLQHQGSEIPKIIRPILEGKADAVIGERNLRKVKNYPLYKLISQSIGNFLATVLFRTKIKDATSGFRAFTKEAASVLIRNLRNDYTYTLETICILAKKKRKIRFVPVNTRYPTRESRLIKNKIYYAANFLFTLWRCLLFPFPCL